jgi:predicted transcriptional regulator
METKQVLGETKMKILTYASRIDDWPLQECTEALNLSNRAIRPALQELIDSGFIEKDGGFRTMRAFYNITEKGLDLLIKIKNESK